MRTSRLFGRLVSAPLIGTLVLVLLAACTDALRLAPATSPESLRLRGVIAEALPGLEAYELVAFPQGEEIARRLRGIADDLAGVSPADPIGRFELPVLAKGGITTHPFTLYYVNVRGPEVGLFDYDPEQGPRPAAETVRPYSYTFRGLPADERALERALFMLALGDEKALQDEARYQASTVSLIGDELAFSYSGPQLPNASVGQGLRSLLQPYVPAPELERLLREAGVDYIVYDPADDATSIEAFHPKLGPERSDPPRGAEHDHAGHAHAGAPRPQNHFFEDGEKTLRPSVIADATIYDPDTRTWLVTDWFERVDTAVLRQDFAWTWTQLGADIPPGASALPRDNNRLSVRTKVSQYYRLTRYGKTLADPAAYPSDGCKGSDTLIKVFRDISAKQIHVDNEYWLWWTNDRGSGCAYGGVLGLAPRDGNVGWVGMRNKTADRSALTFAHESGHIIDASHSIDAEGDTGWTASSSSGHRCYLLGIFPLNPQGASLMSYDTSGSRTYCFAYTGPEGSPKKNTTRVAEFLHTALP